MIKHKPKDRTNVKLDGKIYYCINGIVELPRAYKQFNPVEEEVKDRKKKEKRANE